MFHSIFGWIFIWKLTTSQLIYPIHSSTSIKYSIIVIYFDKIENEINWCVDKIIEFNWCESISEIFHLNRCFFLFAYFPIGTSVDSDVHVIALIWSRCDYDISINLNRREEMGFSFFALATRKFIIFDILKWIESKRSLFRKMI